VVTENSIFPIFPYYEYVATNIFVQMTFFFLWVITLGYSPKNKGIAKSKGMNAFIVLIINRQLALQKIGTNLHGGQQCLWDFFVEPNTRGFIHLIYFY
jgi:hypothetical protein